MNNYILKDKLKPIQNFVGQYNLAVRLDPDAAAVARAEFDALEKLIDEREQFLRETNPHAAKIFEMMWIRFAIPRAMRALI